MLIHASVYIWQNQSILWDTNSSRNTADVEGPMMLVLFLYDVWSLFKFMLHFHRCGTSMKLFQLKFIFYLLVTAPLSLFMGLCAADCCEASLHVRIRVKCYNVIFFVLKAGDNSGRAGTNLLLSHSQYQLLFSSHLTHTDHTNSCVRAHLYMFMCLLLLSVLLYFSTTDFYDFQHSCMNLYVIVWDLVRRHRRLFLSSRNFVKTHNE